MMMMMIIMMTTTSIILYWCLFIFGWGNVRLFERGSSDTHHGTFSRTCLSKQYLKQSSFAFANFQALWHCFVISQIVKIRVIHDGTMKKLILCLKHTQ